MKITFHCDNGANIHSEYKAEINLSEVGLTEDEWRALDDDGKNEVVKEWALERYEYWFQEE
ncbi:hypothetical protein G3N95_29850 [Paraburkholderia sp. Tr-20389]|uniref:DUF7167 family protein n=1 Tax=Paraburkholderia sp. Tr-20389 TaxID=2703903 RepID=UPI00197CECC3|nr:hypothetical protein [Paraburkholderia sp. Tr-20389]MBN3757179.1 hypothetical protein [Paraburkholderia sp. Tr-20389]